MTTWFPPIQVLYGHLSVLFPQACFQMTCSWTLDCALVCRSFRRRLSSLRNWIEATAPSTEAKYMHSYTRMPEGVDGGRSFVYSLHISSAKRLELL